MIKSFSCALSSKTLNQGTINIYDDLIGIIFYN